MQSKLHLIHQQINKSFPVSQGRALRGVLMAEHLILEDDIALVADGTKKDLLRMPVNGGVWYDLHAWLVFGTKSGGGYNDDDVWAVSGSLNGTAEAQTCIGTITRFNKDSSAEGDESSRTDVINSADFEIAASPGETRLVHINASIKFYEPGTAGLMQMYEAGLDNIIIGKGTKLSLVQCEPLFDK